MRDTPICTTLSIAPSYRTETDYQPEVTLEPYFDKSLARRRLESVLFGSFDAVPLEVGLTHPAEEIITATIRSEEGLTALEWLGRL